jgi:hypothetical protein
VVLQQAVHGRARKLAVTDAAGRAQHTQDLAHRAAGVVTLGLEDGLLQIGGDARGAAVGARLGGERLQTVASPGVVPGLDRLLADAAARGAGDRVIEGGKLGDAPLQLASVQMLAAHQRPEHR